MATKHTFLGKDGLVTKELTRGRAIREKCMNCCCWNSAEVRRCGAKDCPLYPFRLGRISTEIDSDGSTTPQEADSE